MDPQFAEVSAAFHTEIEEIKMINAGTIGMPLHFGRVPLLTERMGKMGDAIVESIVENYGKSEVLTRMSDPNWFQAFGAVMGMHWNSSGVTATVLGALQRRINPKARSLGSISSVAKAAVWRGRRKISHGSLTITASRVVS